MPKINVTIEVPEFADGELRKAIINKAASLVLEQEEVVRYDADDNEWTELTPGLLGKMRVEAGNQAQAAVKAVVDAEVPQVVREVLDGTFTPMSRWGEPQGEPTTIRAMAGEEAQRWLTEQTDRRGRTGYSTDGPKKPRLHWMVAEMVDSAWKEHLRSEAAEVAKQVKAKLNEKLSEDVAKAVRGLLNL